MRRFDWWESLRVRHEVLVGPYCVRWSTEDRRGEEPPSETVLSYAQALDRPDLPVDLAELLRAPDEDPDLQRERVEQQDWLERWRAVPEEEALAEVKPRALTPLGLGRLAALRTDRALLNSQAMPMTVLGVAGQVQLPRPHHFATSGFAQRGLFVLEQHGHVFVLDEQARLRATTLAMAGWGLPPYRLTPIALDGATLIVELRDPTPDDRHPDLRELLGESCRLRLDFAEGWVGRKAL